MKRYKKEAGISSKTKAEDSAQLELILQDLNKYKEIQKNLSLQNSKKHIDQLD